MIEKLYTSDVLIEILRHSDQKLSKEVLCIYKFCEYENVSNEMVNIYL